MSIDERIESANPADSITRYVFSGMQLRKSDQWLLSSNLGLDPNNEGLPRHGDIIGWHPEDELLQTQMLAELATGFISAS